MDAIILMDAPYMMSIFPTVFETLLRLLKSGRSDMGGDSVTGGSVDGGSVDGGSVDGGFVSGGAAVVTGGTSVGQSGCFLHTRYAYRVPESNLCTEIRRPD